MNEMQMLKEAIYREIVRLDEAYATMFENLGGDPDCDKNIREGMHDLWIRREELKKVVTMIGERTGE